MSTSDHKVDLEDNSKYNVAYKLMTEIAFHENQVKTREYLLTLYRQCIRTVVPVAPMKDILAMGPSPRR